MRTRVGSGDTWDSGWDMRGRLSTRLARGSRHEAMTTASKLAKAAGLAIGATAVVAARDVTQKRHAILRNFPVIGHLRYLLERFGPELRQYIVTGNDEERPFTRDQRRWVYASAKQREQLLRVRHRQRPRARRRLPDHQAPHVRRRRARRPPGTPATSVPLPVRQGARRAARPRARRSGPASVVNISAMSFGSLSRQRRSRRSTAAPRWPAACRTPARAASRRTTATAATSSSRSAPATSAAATSTAASTSPGSRTSSRRRPVRAIEIKLSPGRQARPRRRAARRQGHAGDRRDPRHPARARTAPRPAGTPRSTTSTRCSTSSSCSPTRPGCRSASSRRSATWTFWDELADADGRPPAAASTSSPSTAARAAPARRRWSSPTHVALPFQVGLRAGLRDASPSRASPTTSSSSAPASSASPRTPSSRSRSAATWSTSAARRCCRSAASRRSSATPTTARPASPPRTRGWCAASTRARSRCGPPTTSRRCAATCSRSPRRAASCTPA